MSERQRHAAEQRWANMTADDRRAHMAAARQHDAKARDNRKANALERQADRLVEAIGTLGPSRQRVITYLNQLTERLASS